MNLGVQVAKEGREGFEMVGLGPRAGKPERKRQGGQRLQTI